VFSFSIAFPSHLLLILQFQIEKKGSSVEVLRFARLRQSTALDSRRGVHISWTLTPDDYGCAASLTSSPYPQSPVDLPDALDDSALPLADSGPAEELLHDTADNEEENPLLPESSQDSLTSSLPPASVAANNPPSDTATTPPPSHSPPKSRTGRSPPPISLQVLENVTNAAFSANAREPLCSLVPTSQMPQMPSGSSLPLAELQIRADQLVTLVVEHPVSEGVWNCSFRFANSRGPKCVLFFFFFFHFILFLLVLRVWHYRR
jgi:hypothetical protein